MLQQFRKGYSKFAAEQGYRQTSAKPWTEQEILGVLHHIEGQLKKNTGMPAVLLARDGFIFAVLWQTKSRGCNAGAWRLENIKLPTGMNSVPWSACQSSLVSRINATSSTTRLDSSNCYAAQTSLPYIYPDVRLPVGAKVALNPDRTKTGAKDGPMSVELRGDLLCSMTWLNKLLCQSEELGMPITNFVTRPLHKNKVQFIGRHMKSTDVANRVSHHFKAAGLYRGQTVHGSKRGSMQFAVHVLGQSMEEVAYAAPIRTPAIVQRSLQALQAK